MTRWVLLRGLAREAGHWGEFPARLGEALGPGHAVQALDLPGNGTRHGERSPANVRDLMQACRDRLPAGEPVVLVALSLGAMVALEWARAAPGECAGCVLVNTSAGRHATFRDRLRPANYLAIARLLAGRVPLEFREREILRMTSIDPARHAAQVHEWVRLASKHPVRAANAARQLIAAARYRAPALPPPVPILVVASAQDALVSPRCSMRLAAAWQAPLRMHPAAGHDLPLDDPAWLADAVASWWSSNCHATATPRSR